MAPRLTAVLTAVPRSSVEGWLASTSRMWQLGQTAETMSRSSDSSSAQPESALGGVLPPVSLTFLKQPLAVVQAGSPYWERYVPRSDSAFGSS